MATATGLTAAEMRRIEARCVVDGAVDLAGNLTFETYDGTIISAGNVKGPTGATGPTGPTGPTGVRGLATFVTSTTLGLDVTTDVVISYPPGGSITTTKIGDLVVDPTGQMGEVTIAGVSPTVQFVGTVRGPQGPTGPTGATGATGTASLPANVIPSGKTVNGAIGTAPPTDPALRDLGFTSSSALPGDTTLNEIAVPDFHVGFNGFNAKNLADPVSAQDAVTRNFLEGDFSDHARYVARLQDAMIVTGASNNTGWRPSWTSLMFPNVGYLSGKIGSTSAYTAVAMPSNGTVITGHGGSSNVTVSSGSIPNPSQGQYGILWWDPGLDGGTPAFHISGYGTAWTAPRTWIPIYEWNAAAPSGTIGRFLINVSSWIDNSNPLLAPPKTLRQVSSLSISNATWTLLSSNLATPSTTWVPARSYPGLTDCATVSSGVWTALYSGIYDIRVQLTWQFSNATGERAFYMTLNTTDLPSAAGDTDVRHWRVGHPASPGFTTVNAVHDGVYLGAGAALRFYGYQTSGLAGTNPVGGGQGDKISIEFKGAW